MEAIVDKLKQDNDDESVISHNSQNDKNDSLLELLNALTDEVKKKADASDLTFQGIQLSQLCGRISDL